MQTPSALLAIIAIAASQPASAHEAQTHVDPGKAAAAAASPAGSAEETLEEIRAGLAAVDAMLVAGRTGEIHGEVEKIEASLSALRARAAGDAEDKARLDASARQLAGSLGKAHEAGDKGDMAAAVAAMKKAHAAVKLLRASLR